MACRLIGGALLGLVCLCTFSCLWNVVKVYTSRAQLKQVAFKPPSVPVIGCCGLQRFWCVRIATYSYSFSTMNLRNWYSLYDRARHWYILRTSVLRCIQIVPRPLWYWDTGGLLFILVSPWIALIPHRPSFSAVKLANNIKCFIF